METLRDNLKFCIWIKFYSKMGWMRPKFTYSLTLLLLFIPATLIAATIQTWQAWAAAEGLYRKLAWIRIAQALGVAIGQIALGVFATPTAVEMSIGYVGGVIAGLCVAVYTMPIKLSFSMNISKFLYTLKTHWAYYRRFPLFSLPADTINTVAGQIPLLIIASEFGAEASGLYALTTRILGAPIGLLGTAVLDVFKRSAAVSYREKGHCRNEYLHTLWILTMGGVLLTLGVIFMAEPLFVFAFGEPWRKAGIISVWLMPMFALRFIASPLSYVFYIANKQNIDLIWQCALLGMTLIAFLLTSSFEQSVKMYAIGYSFLYMVYLALSYHYSKGHTA